MAKLSNVDANELDEELNVVIHRLVQGHTTSTMGYVKRLTEIAEQYQLLYEDVEDRLVVLLDGEEYTDEERQAVPSMIGRLLSARREALPSR